MKFSRRRGRPRIEKQKTDLGTKELRAKRALDITIEPLELCLKKQLIDHEMYQAGAKLRWLYQLQFGKAHVRAYDPTNLGGRSTAADNEAWLAEKKEEYMECIHILAQAKVKSIVINVCVFNQRPAFLMPYKKSISITAKRDMQHRYQKFYDGLELLAHFWGLKEKDRLNMRQTAG